MLEFAELVYDVLPNLVGISLAGIFLFQAYRLRENLFAVVRTYVLVLLVVSLMSFWGVKLLEYLLEGVETGPEIPITFVLVAAWLSTCWMAMTALYRNHEAVGRFGRWLRRNPMNLMTLWGFGALFIAVMTWSVVLFGGMDDHRNTLLLSAALYLVAAATFDVWMILRTKAEGFVLALPAEGYRGALLLLSVWIGIPLVAYASDGVLEGFYAIESYGLGDWMVVALFGIVATWVRRRGFLALIVEPEEETVKLAGYRNFDIPRGVYLIEEEKPESAFRLFSDLVILPLRPDASIPVAEESAAATLEFLIPRGLVVTREYPDTLRGKYDLHVTPMIWLTESPGDRRIAPTSLAVLTDTLIRFMESNPNGIVLLEGMEYLVTFNEFRKVLKHLDSLNETAWITRTRLLVTIDPRAFDERELALLERDREVLRDEGDVEELRRKSVV